MAHVVRGSPVQKIVENVQSDGAGADMVGAVIEHVAGRNLVLKAENDLNQERDQSLVISQERDQSLAINRERDQSLAINRERDQSLVISQERRLLVNVCTLDYMMY